MERRAQFMPKLINHAFTLLCYGAAGLSLFMLLLILVSLVQHGYHQLTPRVLTHNMAPAMMPGGGLANALVGSLMMVLLATLLSVPVGIAVAVYLVEYAKKSRLSKWVRFANDVLLTSPSIIIGLFIFTLFVHPFHAFSGLAGSVALFLIALPMVVRTTEDVLYLVSPMLREAALALGVAQWRTVLSVILRSARSGIITGVLLAMARIAGETAPLLFTSFRNQYFTFNMLHPMASLPTTIYLYAMSPYPDWKALAWTGALLITAFVFVLNMTARWFAWRTDSEKKS